MSMLKRTAPVALLVATLTLPATAQENPRIFGHDLFAADGALIFNAILKMFFPGGFDLGKVGDRDRDDGDFFQHGSVLAPLKLPVSDRE